MVKQQARVRNLKLKILAKKVLLFIRQKGIFECQYCGITVHSSKIVLAERHVETKRHFQEQKYHFEKLQRLKDRTEIRR